MQVTVTEKGHSHEGHLAQTKHQTITPQAMAWHHHVIMTVFKPRYAKFQLFSKMLILRSRRKAEKTESDRKEPRRGT